MDYEKYYKIGIDGTYNIHFPNKKGLSIDEIREIFSSYGNVLSINISGDLNGLRYIRYKTLEETVRCLEDMQNNSDIRILRQKDKLNANKKTDQKYSNQQQAIRIDNSSKKAFNTNRQFNSNLNHNEKSSTTRETSVHNWSGSDLDNRSDNTDNFTDTNSRNSRQNYKFNNADNNKKSPDSLISDKKHSLSSQQNLGDNKVSNCKASKQQESKLYSSTKSNANCYIKKLISTENKIPALISESEDKQKEFDTMSDYSLPAGTRNASSKVVIPVQEVIVANIHSNYGVHYILHLFEKYSPISATCVKTISETGIRYCHVYFKTVQDALAIEEEFDNFVLSGQNLIVLRKSCLIDTIMCK